MEAAPQTQNGQPPQAPRRKWLRVARWILIAVLAVIALCLIWFNMRLYARDFVESMYDRYTTMRLSTRADVVRISNNNWPGADDDLCQPDQVCHPDVATVECGFVEPKPPADPDDPFGGGYACTTDYQIPTDLCNNNFACRVINGKCKKVVNIVGYKSCMSCWDACKSRFGWEDMDPCLKTCNP